MNRKTAEAWCDVLGSGWKPQRVAGSGWGVEKRGVLVFREDGKWNCRFQTSVKNFTGQASTPQAAIIAAVTNATMAAQAISIAINNLAKGT